MSTLNITSWSDGDKLTPSSMNNVHSEVEAIVNDLDNANIANGAAVNLDKIATSSTDKRLFRTSVGKDSLLCDYIQNAEIEIGSADNTVRFKIPSFRAQRPILLAEDGRVGVQTSEPPELTVGGVSGLKYIYAEINTAGAITLSSDSNDLLKNPSIVGSYKHYLGFLFWENGTSKIRGVFSKYRNRPVSDYMAGYVQGCNLSYTDADNIVVGSGKIRFENSFSGIADPIDVVVPSTLGINFTTSGVGGIDTGDTRQLGTWYYIYLVFGINGIECVASTDADEPTTDLTATYDWYRRIGSIFLNNDTTDGTAATGSSVCGFIQTGNYNEKEYRYHPFASPFNVAGTATASGTTITGVGTNFHSGLIGCSIHIKPTNWDYPMRCDNVGRITAVGGPTSLTASRISGGNFGSAGNGGYDIDYQGYPPDSSAIGAYTWNNFSPAATSFPPSALRIPTTANFAFVTGVLDEQTSDNLLTNLFLRPTGSTENYGSNMVGVSTRTTPFGEIKVPMLSTNTIDMMAKRTDNTFAWNIYENRIYISGYSEEL